MFSYWHIAAFACYLFIYLVARSAFFSNCELWNRLRVGVRQAGVLLSHALRDYGTDVPDDWDIDNDGAAVSQLQVNDGATM